MTFPLVIELANECLTELELFKHWYRIDPKKADDYLTVARRKMEHLQREVILETRNSGEVTK